MKCGLSNNSHKTACQKLCVNFKYAIAGNLYSKLYLYHFLRGFRKIYFKKNYRNTVGLNMQILYMSAKNI